ncbi:MAG TPA: histidine--tRNA ligase [Longimicrobiales bacterium]|nr:histidine--tRNA ligase [Longimicrobiales bacterium]
MTELGSLPGFRDFYPEDLARRTRIFAAWREASRRFGFMEYDGPPLEPLDLYTGKSGEEIVRQLYAFTDKGDREVALRPEMTPTFARMVAARAAGLRKPIRWYSIPQLFRYERTQRGRLREHFQWNVDLVGEPDVGGDAEVLAVALTGLELLGLGAGDVVARVSDRRLLEAVLRFHDVEGERVGAAFAAIDKLEREGVEPTLERLREEAGLERGAAEDLLGAVEAGDPGVLAAAAGGDEGVRQRAEESVRYLDALDAMGFGDRVRFDARIVRGLAYYTGIVFEIFDTAGELRAVCGGGRYDALLEQLGGPDLPALGFGMGDVVLGELLASREEGVEAPGTQDHIVLVSEEERGLALRLASALRGRGRSVTYALRETGVGRQFKDANALGARRAIVLGPDEVAEGVAIVKDMESGAEEKMPLDELLSGEGRDDGE